MLKCVSVSYIVSFLFLLLFCLPCAAQSTELKVVFETPKGEVEYLSQIVVQFSESMRSLGVMEQSAQTSPLILSTTGTPLPQGEFRWLGPDTLAYLFHKPVDIPIKITAQVPAGVAALSGAVLKQSQEWDIFTRPLEITLPEDTPPLAPEDAAFTLRSNYPLDPESLLEKSGLTLQSGGRSLPLSLRPEQDQTPPPGIFWRTAFETPTPEPSGKNSWEYVFQVGGNLLATLPAGQKLDLVVGSGVKLHNGPLSEKEFHFSLKGFEPLQVLSLASENRERDKTVLEDRQPETSLPVRFNNPVTLEELLRHLEIKPDAKLARPSLERDGGRLSPGGSRTWYLTYDLQPRAEYTIRLLPGLKDAYGTQMEKQAEASFTTGDYRSEFDMLQGYNILPSTDKGMFPVTFRNVGKVTLRLRYYPWNKDGLATIADYTPYSNENIEQTPLKEKLLSFDSSQEPNQRIVRDLNIPELLDLPDAASVHGIVIVDAAYSSMYRDSKGAMRASDVTSRAVLQWSSFGLSIKLGRENGLAWVTELETGLPAAGIDLALKDTDGRILWSGKSDKQGLAELPGENRIPEGKFFLAASDGRSTGMLYADKKHMETPSRSFAPGKRQWEIYALTQLPLYKPGQKVRFTLFAREYREEDEQGLELTYPWLPLAGHKLALVVRDPAGKEIFSQESVTNSYGSLSGSFTLPEGTALGWYRIEATGEKLETANQFSSFQVAEFRAPEFAVNLTSPPSQPVAPAAASVQAKSNTGGEKAPGSDSDLRAEVQAGYFSGASLAGAKAELSVNSVPSRFQPERLSGYTVGVPGGEPSTLPSPPSALLDHDGKTTFILPFVEVLPGQPRDVRLEATITDTSGITSQGDSGFTLHPASVYVGLRAPRFVSAGKSFQLALRAAGHDNRKLGQIEVTLTALRKTWKNDGKGNVEEESEQVWEKKIPLTDPDGGRVDVSFDKEGSYELSASLSDESGRINRSSLTVLVPGKGISPLYYGGGSLELIPDEESYTPESTARIMISQPFEESLALVTIERSSIRSHQLVSLKGPAPVLDIPLDHKSPPYVYVSMIAIGTPSVQETPGGPKTWGNAGDEPKRAPRLLTANALLKVERPRPHLAVQVESNAKTYRPGETVKAKVVVRELPADTGLNRTESAQQESVGKGSPRKAQVTLLAVDERILRAAGGKEAYDPSSSFPELFPGGVLTENNRHWAENYAYTARMRVRSYGVQGSGEMNDEVLAVAAGALAKAPAPGSGGDVSLRSNFDPMAFWLAEGETDSQGRLAASFSLPDTLTSYRIVAVATDKSGKFATGEHRVEVSQPLQLVSSMPRFLTQGDSLEARILVQNLSDAGGMVTLRAKATGLSLVEKEKRIPLDAGQSGFVSFAVRAERTGKAELSVSGEFRSGKKTERDAAVFSLAVLPRTALTTVAASGILTEGKAHDIKVHLPEGLDQRSGITLSLAPSPAAGVPIAARQVLEYPWDCLEQRMSRAWARIMRLEHGKLLNLKPEADDKDSIAQTMLGAVKFQQRDGGFSLWPSSGSDLYVTAFTLLVSEQAKALRIPLPAMVEDKAYAWIAKKLAQAYPDIENADGSLTGEPAEKTGEVSLFTHPRRCTEGHSPEAEAMALWLLSHRDPLTASQLLPRMRHCFMENESQVNPLAWGALMLARHELEQRQGQTSGSPSPALPGKDDILEILNKSLIQSPTQAYYLSRNEGSFWKSLGSPLRDNALILAALVRTASPGSGSALPAARLEHLASWVSQGLGERETLSTQEGVFGLWGLISYLDSLKGKSGIAMEASLNSRERIRVDFANLTDPPKIWDIPATRLQGNGDSLLVLKALRGNPYWTARLRYASLSQTAKSANAGFHITRSLDRPVSVEPTPETHPSQARTGKAENRSEPAAGNVWNIGDVVEVTLTVTVPATRRHVLVHSPFPAGLEPLHASRVDIAERDLDGSSVWQTRELHDDGLLLYSPGLPPGVYSYTYRLRAAATGDFAYRPATVEEMYTPEVFGRTEEERLQVKVTPAGR